MKNLRWIACSLLIFNLFFKSTLLGLEISYHNLPAVILQRNHSFDFQLKKVYNQEVTYIEYLKSYLPSLGASYDWKKIVKRQESDENPQTITFYMKQPVLLSGEKWSSFEIRKHDFKIAHLNYLKNKDEFIAKTVKSYLEVILKKQEIIITEEFLKNLEIELQIAQKKIELEEMVITDYYEVLSQVQENKINILKEKKALEEMMNGVKASLGVSVKEKLVFLDQIPKSFQVNYRTINKKTYFNLYLSQQSDINIKREEMYKNKILKNSIYWNMIPSVNLNLYYTLNGDGLENTYAFRKEDWGIRLDFVFNLGIGELSTSHGIKDDENDNSKTITHTPKADFFNDTQKNSLKNKYTSELNYLITADEYGRLKDSLEISFESILKDMDLSYRILNLLKLKVEIDEKKLTILNQQYQLGEITIVDFFKKKTELKNLKITYYRELVNYITKVYNLENSLGVESGFLGLVKHHANLP